MNGALKGVALGAAAGILGVTPMAAQGLTWDANISAFTMWVIIGFLFTTVSLTLRAAPRGLVVLGIAVDRFAR